MPLQGLRLLSRSRSAKLRIFTGVEEELLESLINERPRHGGRQAGHEGLELQAPAHMPATVSVSRRGSCMIIEGLL
jgi:hypothetical protein